MLFGYDRDVILRFIVSLGVTIVGTAWIPESNPMLILGFALILMPATMYWTRRWSWR